MVKTGSDFVTSPYGIKNIWISTLENGFKKLWIHMPDSPGTCAKEMLRFKNIWIRVDGA